MLKSSNLQDVRPHEHFRFLDGLRAAAAVYVVFYHTFLSVLPFQKEGRVEASFWDALSPLRYGHFAVNAFIVLSGFCLMLPVARSGDRRLRGGAMKYLYRRARRILPPYYAALACSVLLLLTVRPVAELITPAWNVVHPLTSRSIIEHLMLVHDFFGIHRFSINPPLWSVAVEWQIYFLLPLVLLPAWRKGGAVLLLTVVIPLSVGFPIAAKMAFVLVYVALFVFGMIAAIKATEWSVRPYQPVRDNFLFGITAAGTVGFSVLLWRVPNFHEQSQVIADTIVGVICSAWLTVLTVTSSQSAAGRLIYIIRYLLETRLALWLGTFSYSTYLMHMPLLACVQGACRAMRFSPGQEILTLFLSIPGVILGTYVFFLLCERPTLPSFRLKSEAAGQTERQKLDKLVVATVRQPAP